MLDPPQGQSARGGRLSLPKPAHRSGSRSPSQGPGSRPGPPRRQVFRVLLKGKWSHFMEDTNEELVTAYRSGATTTSLTICGNPYHYDFARMKQFNGVTGRERDIRLFEEPVVPAESTRPRHTPGDPMIVSVRVLQGRGLVNTELIGNMDPYCVLSVGGGKPQKTEVVANGGSDVVWAGDAGLVHLPWNGEEDLLIQIWDSDTMKTDDYVGECCINLFVVVQLHQSRWKGSLQVFRSGTEHSGVIDVDVMCINPQPKPTPLKLVQAIPARKHKSYLVGIAQAITALEMRPSMFICYAVALVCVHHIFKDVVNGNHDKEHAKIWVDDAQGLCLREMLKSEHTTLYSGPVLPNRDDLYLRTGSDFLGMIHDGVRVDVRRVYTYSIVDKGLFFSETSAAFLKDANSKHAVHACAEAKVRYAGTFRICVRPNGGRVMVFDNDSGTYRPRGEDLHLTKQLLECNFPGLDLIGLSVLDAQPEETKVFVGPNEIKDDPSSVYAGTWRWRQ